MSLGTGKLGDRWFTNRKNGAVNAYFHRFGDLDFRFFTVFSHPLASLFFAFLRRHAQENAHAGTISLIIEFHGGKSHINPWFSGYYGDKETASDTSFMQQKKSYSHCVFSRVLRDSTIHFVGPSVGRLVGPLFTFLAFLSFLGSQLLPKCHYKSF